MAEIMALVIAEHDNAGIRRAHPQHRHRRRAVRRRGPRAGRRRGLAGAAARPPRRSPASPRCCTPTRAQLRRRPGRERRRAGAGAGAGLLAHPVRRPPPPARTSRRASPPSSTSAQISDITKVDAPDTFERPIYAGNAIATVQSLDTVKVITVRTTGFDPAPATGGSAAVETVERGRRLRQVDLRRRRDRQVDRPELTAAKIIVSGGRGDGLERQVQRGADAAGRQARRGAGRQPRRGRRRLRAERLAGRPDRQDRRAAAVHRRRHLRRDPAPGRHEGLQGHRRDQQGSGGADLQRRRLRARGDLFEAVPELVKAL